MSLLGVENSAEHHAVLCGLGNSECIFRDLEDRASRIGIDLISDEMRHVLDTNPTRARPNDPAEPTPLTADAPRPLAAGTPAYHGYPRWPR
jgi:hypothetical protein